MKYYKVMCLLELLGLRSKKSKLVYTPEGGQTQQIGLKPDIECYQTVEAIREGRDTLIEKAIELIH